MDTFTLIISFILVAVLFTDISAAWLLLRGASSADYSIVALNERAGVAAIQGVSASLLAILGANRIFNWNLGEVLVLLILSTALVIQALPSIIWLSLYFTGRFYKGND